MRLRAYLLIAFGTLSIVVAGVVGSVLGTIHFQRQRAAIDERLATVATAIGGSLDEYLEKHRDAVATLAGSLSGEDQLDEEEVERMLGEYHRTYDLFLTMLAADLEGRVVATSPRLTESGGLFRSVVGSIQDRDYFRKSISTRESFMSDAFQGRGFGSDPVVALSAPVIGPTGDPIGIVEGSLDLGAFRRFETTSSEINADLMIVDRSWSLVFAASAFDIDALTTVRNHPLISVAGESGNVFEYEEALNEHYVVAGVETASGWRVYLRQPIATVERELARDLALTITLLAFATVVSLIVAHILAGRISRPLDRVVDAIHSLHSDEPIEIEVEGRIPREVRSLIDDFNEMTRRLARSRASLQAALEEEAQLREDLEAEHAELEEAVETRLLVQRELQMMNRQLEIARKIALEGSRAKSAFLSTMSHELRTPLNAILGFSEVLVRRLERVGGDEAARTQASNISEAGRQMLSLVEQLIEIARVESGEEEMFAEECDPREVLMKAASFAEKPAQNRGNEFIVDIPENLGRAWLDEEKLQHAVINLLANACKFTQNGRILLSARREEKQDAEYLVIRVTDTGIGIEIADLNRLFQPFTQVDETLGRRYEGAGVGLAITKRLVELMKGEIDAESDLGRGSMFMITIPTGSRKPAVP